MMSTGARPRPFPMAECSARGPTLAARRARAAPIYDTITGKQGPSGRAPRKIPPGQAGSRETPPPSASKTNGDLSIQPHSKLGGGAHLPRPAAVVLGRGSSLPWASDCASTRSSARRTRSAQQGCAGVVGWRRWMGGWMGGWAAQRSEQGEQERPPVRLPPPPPPPAPPPPARPRRPPPPAAGPFLGTLFGGMVGGRPPVLYFGATPALSRCGRPLSRRGRPLSCREVFLPQK